MQRGAEEKSGAGITGNVDRSLRFAGEIAVTNGANHTDNGGPLAVVADLSAQCITTLPETSRQGFVDDLNRALIEPVFRAHVGEVELASREQRYSQQVKVIGRHVHDISVRYRRVR